MEVIKNLQAAWQKDSFYIQTTSRNGISIFRAGAFGFMASRVSGVGFPRDQTIYSVIYQITNIFIEFIENTFVKEPLMSDNKVNKTVEKFLRMGIKIKLCESVTRKICPLLGARKVIMISWETIVDFSIIKLIFARVFIEILFM